MTANFVRSHIQTMKPYDPIVPPEVLSEELGLSEQALIKLDANENPYGMPPSAIRRLMQMTNGQIYPDPESRHLRQRLSEHFQVPVESLVAGAGADELIDLVVRLTMAPGDRIIDCPPTFGYYETIAQVNHLSIVSVRRKSDFSLNYQKIEEAVKQGARLIFLANPNNPDGGLFNPNEIKKLLDLPLLVVVDEAYIEFADPGLSLVSAVLQQDNLIVLRTFSKWGGLAGLRLGYGVFPLRLAREIMKIKPPYNVSVAASEAGIGALEDVVELNQRRQKILAQRDRLMQVLPQLGYLSPYPSSSNFILCRVTKGDANQLKRRLSERGVLIRYFNKPGLEDHVRITVGSSEDNDQLLDELEALTP